MDSASGQSILEISNTPVKAKSSLQSRKRKHPSLKLDFSSIVNDNAVAGPSKSANLRNTWNNDPEPHYLGSLVYASAKTWQGVKRVDLRSYECCERRKQLYPTKNGISLDLQEWVHIDFCKSDIEHEIARVKEDIEYVGVMTVGRTNFIKIYRSSHDHRIYVDIRKYDLFDEPLGVSPTRCGVKLTLEQWKKLKDINFNDDIPELANMTPCWYDSSHSNQEYRCPYCAKDTSGVRKTPEYGVMITQV
ncbi:uncharacterized protein LOC141909153 [Tubulanus polymorphus]|uniref:uncharacterized protein LOC141909153 n=1 Tax=Tubulanus polymorphus TaxID=672921 RepID=UPI003DA38F5E